jgi:plasmid stability protein
MAQVIIRNLDDGVVERLKRQAARDSTSLEQRLRDVLTMAADEDEERAEKVIQRLAEKTAHLPWDPTDLIREDRDR